MTRLTNKVAIITGSGSGMGKEEALLFAKEGAKVVATDIQVNAVQEVVDEIKAAGGEALALAHDVTSEDDWKSVMQTTIDTHGKLDILVNNAGISQPEPMEELTLARWNQIININLTSTFLGIKLAIPHMRENKGGSIINISSIAGLTGSSGAGAYTASKGGVRMLTKAAAVDYGKDNIRVNSVHPGFIKTPMSEEFFEREDMKQWFLAQTALPQLGKPIEVAEAVLFLASDAAYHITGVELPVDGGVVAK
ncbi:MAG: SDR family NAD(P)-dependent oxidoreductase [Bacillota bacterium]|uniref:SDR family oxidoreductase n=1 Tax=Virgibacillus salarius TaxID=447199 RepID=A0A941DQH4_9BACI|nr:MULTISPECIES: SDR family NAD(P)-dependent oxidoreductase [Bacillaceae]NAZ07816.1 glucose 1-dehydrogenase [Agaribacter marinus]MBR7795099.1 SDR family oxidoreductase [Virgibacillus salarius]MCC2248397.1 SDR family oxidoreductase [Virgibacillus sp. AGTR]MDY7045450.1 SDR family NAD(P)-dependent oxidoreductase [Virgibacillus sp. M23]QRZ16740.1 SDR family oxidoreductase [Virgibacillus sp. AGTR]